MKIHVSSRNRVNEVVKSCVGSVCIVSITDPGEEPVAIGYGEVPVLRLQFHDYDRIIPGMKDVCYFTSDRAFEIVQFIKRHMSDNVVIHCEVGISRSPAIAAAISHHFVVGSWWEWFKNYIPNFMVFTLMMNELGFVTHKK